MFAMLKAKEDYTMPLEERVAKLEGIFEQIEKRLGFMEATLNQFRTEVSGKFQSFESKFDNKFDKLTEKIDSVNARLTLLVLSTWVTVMLAILFKK